MNIEDWESLNAELLQKITSRRESDCPKHPKKQSQIETMVEETLTTMKESQTTTGPTTAKPAQTKVSEPELKDKRGPQKKE